MTVHVLLVEDEADFRAMLRMTLTRAGYAVTAVANGEEALAALGNALVPSRDPAAPGAVDVIVSDVMMPVLDGLGLIRAVRADQQTAELPFMFLTARGESAHKLEGFRGGADDYITKPFELEDLLARMHVLARRAGTTRTLRDLLPAPTAARPEARLGDLYAKVSVWEQRFPALAVIRRDSIVGASPRTLLLLRDVLVAAPTRDAVLIIGETGTGKTGVAEALHRLGPAPHRPFRVVNCAELAAADPAITLGKLFGYGKGSGLAHVPKEGQTGLLEEVDGGTLFLDEVHRLPPAAQGQLLLAIERRPFMPAVGVGEPKTVNVKFIFATNVDLHAEANAGRFPFDLYQRLAQTRICVPPLCERREDIAALAEHFLDECKGSAGIDEPTFAPSLLQHLVARDYPGNIRELRALVRATASVAAFEQDTVLVREHIPASADEAAVRTVATTTEAFPAVVDSGSRAPRPVPPLFDAAHMNEAPWNEVDLRDLLALRRHRFRIMEAEHELGYSEKSRTLTNHLRTLCFKALAHTRFDVASAARCIVGSNDQALLDRTTDRIESYLAIVERHVGAHTVEMLYNNVQVDYRRYVDEAVERERARLHEARTQS